MAREEQEEITQTTKNEWQAPQLTFLEYMEIETSSQAFQLNDGFNVYS